jgi:hypothetical protein
LIKETLIPIINQKSAYLHGEGIAMAVYGLAEAEYWEPETWKLLATKMRDHNFDYELVK